jgi:hypothetical protein
MGAAFAPSTAFARSSSLSMSAVETPTFTFTKSEEIFAEAQNVRIWIPVWWCRIAQHSTAYSICLHAAPGKEWNRWID